MCRRYRMIDSATLERGDWAGIQQRTAEARRFALGRTGAAVRLAQVRCRHDPRMIRALSIGLPHREVPR